MMKTISCRIVAVFVAVVLCFAGIGSVAASASTKVNVSSGLSYTLSVRKTGSNELILYVDFTNSLTLTYLEFMLFYDDKCTLVSVDCGDAGTCQYSNSSHSAFYAGLFSGKKGNFTFEFHFKTSDSADNPHTFGACVTAYWSTSGNYTASGDRDVTIKTGDLYTVGDVDNNGVINAIDARDVLLIADIYTTVEEVNKNLTQVQSKVSSTIVCGEAADANCDGYITSADSDAILNYYASMNVYPNYEDQYIGKDYYVTITV